LSKEDIEKMKKEAEQNAEADLRRKEEADKINAADSLVFSTEKQLKEYGDKLPADKKTTIEEAAAKLKEAVAAKNFADMEIHSKTLNDAWQAASQDMYNATGDQPGAEGQENPGAGQNNGNANADDVQDVDFEEVK
jgi:molecular chaperone DnaK